MSFAEESRTPVLAAALFTLVAAILLAPVGLMIADATADAQAMAVTAVSPDIASDQVAATAAEFRVDESGAATYSIPLYTVPGTAGVAPKLSLNYSSQGGTGPLGKGWSIGGLSSIARCRSTREAGDFISGGVPVDGAAPPINFTATDRFCLDGQRMLAVAGTGAECKAVAGMSVVNYRTELESFQRVCGYTPTSGTEGPAFFTVERKDGSISWYGDRDTSDGSANRLDGYVNSTAGGYTAVAVAWAQTRLQDSTGNYMDYLYWNIQPNGDTREHLLKEVRFTGKTMLPGQTGAAMLPYARIVFTYSARPAAEWSYAYQSGGRVVQSRRLDSILSLGASEVHARYYQLGYGISASNSGQETLTSVQECSDSSLAVCLPATTFAWSGAKYEFKTAQVWNPNLFGSTRKFEGFKFGDVDGDGRPDLVWLKDGASGETCATEHVLVSFGEIDSSGRQTFGGPVFAGCTPTELQGSLGEGSWQLFDYTGDGRDDLFVAGGGKWFLYASVGHAGQPFNTGADLLASIYIPQTYSPTAGYHPQLTDLNGDGLFDVVYLNGGMRVRLMERSGSNFVWGAERVATFVAEAPPPCPPEAIDGCTVSSPFLYDPERFRLNDFNGDSASDLIFTVNQNWKELCEGDLEMCPKPVLHVTQPRRYAYGVSAITATTVEFKRQSQVLADMWWNSKPLVGDVNGDGLTDLVYQLSTPGQAYAYSLNTGTSFLPSVAIAGLPWPQLAKLVDVNGDGRADLAYPEVGPDGARRYYVRHALSSGGFGAAVPIAGSGALACIEAVCDPATYANMFSDLDGDGALDYFAIKIEDDNPKFVLSQPDAAHRAEPRDVIVSITNGLGGKTELTYAPLTNSAIYRPDSNSRNLLNWGRGSAVQDFMAPVYVVAKASSSSPVSGNPNAMASLFYRYAGAKVQSGGRGFLGFREIVTYDPNQSGGYVATSTEYAQNFPYVGMPMRTIKRAVVGSAYIAPSCLGLMPNNACYGYPGTGHPALTGSWFSDSAQDWEAAPAFAPGLQAPLHVRSSGTEEKLRDPIAGVQTSTVGTAFDYDAYGNVTSTQVGTFAGSSTTPMSTVTTANTYTDTPAIWRLGRLHVSTVTHSRPGHTNVVRKAEFAYDPITGQLNLELTQPDLSADQSSRKEYTLDEFGNRTAVKTCNGTRVACPATVDFHPTSLMAFQRYQSVSYDSRGRFPLSTNELFWSGTGSYEVPTQTIVSRDKFGNVAESAGINYESSMAVAGNFGRPYYTWKETIYGAATGDPAGGLESTTAYAWCGSGVSCPTGAKFRQTTTIEGAPTVWTYFDLLGRPIFKISETFNAGVSGKDYVGMCTDYDTAGRVARVSNPFFILTPGNYANACTSATAWTTTTYDILGRPTLVQAPDTSTLQTQYSGLVTTTTDPRGHSTAVERNAKGELGKVTDDAGLVAIYDYFADGNMASVSRDAGRGAVINAFTTDASGRKIAQNDPDAGVSTFEYNALGELVAQTDADGNRIENEIDGRGRIWRKTVKRPGGAIESQSTFVYDIATAGAGQLYSETISGTYAGWAPGDALSFERTYMYDPFQRPAGSFTIIDGVQYSTQNYYDAQGRLWKAKDASGRYSKTEFTARGFARATCSSTAADTSAICPNTADTYVATLEADAWGNAIKERRGNLAAMDVTRAFNATTGRLERICAGDAANCSLMEEEYGWDAAGNLSTQLKENRYLESFMYDGLNRLGEAKLLMEDGITVNKITQAFEYDKLGNICRKTVGTQTQDYTYYGRAGCGTGGLPGSGGSGIVGSHQVSAVSPSVPAFYYYDGRGNQTQQDSSTPDVDRTVSYTADDKAYDIVMGTGQRERFWYGSDGQRYKRVGGGKTTIYLGNVEIVTDGGVTTTKRTVAGVMLQTVVGAIASNQYLFHDRLGSLARITSDTGAVINSQDYNAFGTRRDYGDPAGVGTAPALTTRGFTGHEHLDGTGVIHMNGRIFAPGLGRFLQPDPVIQAPDNPQSWNAYTYVFNNPLAYTDPTGMIGIKERKWLGTIVAIVAAVFGQYYASAAIMVGGAFVGGAIATQSFKGGLTAAFVAAVTFGAGVSGFTYWQTVAVQAVTGGIVESLQGGNFGHGFLSAGLTASVMPQVGKINNDVSRTVVGALVGGTISDVTGGKFANGAASGAIQAALSGSKSSRLNSMGGDSPADSAKAAAAAGEANASLEKAGIYRRIAGAGYSSESELAKAWSEAVYPVAEKYKVELGVRIYRGRYGQYALGPTASSGAYDWVDTSALPGLKASNYSLTAVAHTHPAVALGNHLSMSNQVYGGTRSDGTFYMTAADDWRGDIPWAIDNEMNIYAYGGSPPSLTSWSYTDFVKSHSSPGSLDYVCATTVPRQC